MSADPKKITKRNPAYLKWIKTRPCVMCGAISPIDPHHESGIGNSGGMSLKCSDFFAVPLCPICHNYRHQFGYDSFWQGMDVKRIIIDLLIEYITK